MSIPPIQNTSIFLSEGEVGYEHQKHIDLENNSTQYKLVHDFSFIRKQCINAITDAVHQTNLLKQKALPLLIMAYLGIMEDEEYIAKCLEYYNSKNELKFKLQSTKSSCGYDNIIHVQIGNFEYKGHIKDGDLVTDTATVIEPVDLLKIHGFWNLESTRKMFIIPNQDISALYDIHTLLTQYTEKQNANKILVDKYGANVNALLVYQCADMFMSNQSINQRYYLNLELGLLLKDYNI